MTLQVAAHEAVLTSAHFQRRGAGLVDTGGAVFLSQRQHAQNASYRSLAVLAVHAAAERADLLAGLVGAAQQLLCAQWRVLGAVLFLNAIATHRLPLVLAQPLDGGWVHPADHVGLPLHTDAPAGPAR